jgi:sugar lactone lactonase YvrE
MPHMKAVPAVVALALLLAPAPANAKTTVVADHLARPRGLTIAPDGTLYAALVGSGGRKCNFEGCFGATGELVRVGRNGAVKTVASGLVSMRGVPDGFFSIGADQLDVLPDGRLVTAITAEFNDDEYPPSQVPPAVRAQPGRLVFAGLDGRKTLGPSISAIEYRDDPDQEGKVSNPYGIAVLGDAIYVSDSAANALLEVRGSDVHTIAVFPHTADDAQSVPAALTAGADGALYVGEYTGLRQKPLSARIWRVVPGAAPALFATGLTTVSALAAGPDGALYATELRPGRVVRIAPDGTHAVIATGLHYPGGIAVAADGAIFVSDWSVAGATARDAYRRHTGRIVRVR